MGYGHLKLRRPTVAVETEDGMIQIPVRGLDLGDITFLATEHRATLQALFAAFLGQAGGAGSMGDLIDKAATDAPALVATAIALAIDEPDDIGWVMALPFGVQAAFLEKIGSLTMAGDTAPKKVVEIVMGIAGVTSLGISTGGSGDGGSK